MQRQVDDNARQKANPPPLIDLGFQSTQTENEELALARFLQNLEPTDSRVIELLIDHYAPTIYRLVRALLDCLDENEEHLPPSEVSTVVQQVFVKAALDFDQFEGEASARIWLSKIAVNSAQAHRRKRKRRRGSAYVERAPGHETDHPPTEIEQQCRVAVAGLTEKQHIVVVLHYVHDLTIPHIAHVLNISDEQVHTHLTTAQCVIQQSLSDSQEQRELEQTEAEIDQDAFELTEILQMCWPAPVLALSDIQQLIATVQAKLQQRRLPNRFLVQFKEVSLFGAVILAILVVFWGLWSADTRESEPIFPSTPVPPPTPVEASNGIVKSVSQQEEGSPDDISQMIVNAEPCISADGSVIAFSSSASTLVAGDTNEAFDVFVVDRQTSAIEFVSVNSDGVQGNGISISPRVSADGRLVAFASIADNLVTGDNRTCVLGESMTSCADVFVRDRETNVTERITLAYDGSQANGHSLYPTISANGRWVAYWSDASNLVALDREACGVEENTHNCADIFIYDRELGETGRIPIGRSQEQQARNLISTSDNGRYVAVVLHAGDLAADRVQLTNQTDVFVYDRQTGTLESVNVSSEGVPGNGSSANAVMSPDGRYVAFASNASNLVADDTNGQTDVFVRDRVAGTTERVSIASDGSEGNGDSGTLSYSGLASWGEQISISDDGRYVAFTSFADNLVADQTSSHDIYGLPGSNTTYIHDRQTGAIRSVSFDQPGAGGFHVYLHISGDGRWLGMMEERLDCAPANVCSNIWLYDQQPGVIENLLEDKLPAGRDTVAGRPYLSLWHDSAVQSVAFSPNGQVVATGTGDGIVRLWRTSDGTLLHTLEEHSRPVSGIAFSQDGTCLISGSRDRIVNVWQVSGGALLNQVTEHSSEILSLAVSSNGRWLALGGLGTATIWEMDAERLARIDSQDYSDSYMNGLAFSPDSAILALALSDGTVWLRRIPDGETILRLGGHTGKVLSLAFSPDGELLATGSEDNNLNLWQLDEETDGEFQARHILTLQHPDWVNSLAFSPDGAILASGALDRNVRLWSVPDGELLNSPLFTQGQVANVAFSPDGRLLAVGTVGGHLHLWHIFGPSDSD